MPNPGYETTLEGDLPVVSINGVNSNKSVHFTGTETHDGAVTFNGTVTNNGASVKKVNGSSGNTSPTASQSGQIFLFDSATGITYTLPAPVVGASYDFIVTTSVTSGNHKVITDAGTTFLLGAVLEGSPAGTAIMTQGNGSSHVAVTMNGSTTGGLVGTSLSFRCVTATKWEVTGGNVSSGVPTTPFATS